MPFFFGKGRTLSKYSIAQKNPKNKRLKLSRKRMCKMYFPKIIREVLLNISQKLKAQYFWETICILFCAIYLLLCVIETIRCIYWKRLNNCHCFLEKGRTLSKYSIAQKTHKNKRLKLSRKGNRKLYFLEIIREVLLNISEKQNPYTFG